METKLLIFGILFIVVGLLFITVSVILRVREGNPQKKVMGVFPSAFLIMGCITVTLGGLTILFRNEMTKTVAAVGAIVYLVMLIIMQVIVVTQAKTDSSK